MDDKKRKRKNSERNAKKLCVEDGKTLTTEQKKPIDMALQVEKEQEDSDEERSVGMITPTLLEQIKTILGEYPDDAQIIREMVQNAEDAGATCMKIMCDYRTSVPKGTSDIKQYFKTPGICVYNDAMFSEKDWKGIITIYGSVKKEEPLKVGRFGLGFKSVFHMTDSPVIISGNKLLIIDPLKSENKEQECRVIPLKALKKNHCPELTLACIMNRFGFDSSIFNTETPGQYMGTLFWLPLRQKQSTLSSTVYSEEKARRLLTSFKKEASYNVLFLKSLEKIELYNTEDDESYYKVEMYGVNQDKFRQDRADFCNSLNELNKELPLESITSKFEAVIKTPSTEDHYTVVSCLTGTNLLSDGMKTLMADKDIHNSPYTGVAYCTQTNREKRSMGHIFCFLPLPITENSMTGLPVHVNGFLDLEQNRRHVKEGYSANEAEQTDKPVSSANEAEQTDKSLLWNGGMIKELIPDSYYVLIENLKAKCIEVGNPSNLVSDFYDSIPNLDNVQSSWQPLITSLNKKIIEEENFYTKQGDGMWIKRTEALFAVFDQDDTLSHEKCREVQQTVREFLLDCEENLVELPSHMIRVLEETGHSPQTISPKLIRDKIRNFDGWHSYPNDKKLDLLAFILKDGDYDDLKDIELLPLNSKTFTTYSSYRTDKVYVVCNKKAKLFPGLEEIFISRGSVMDVIWNHLNKMAQEDKFQLSCLTDTSLPEVLQQTFKVNCTQKDGHFVPKEHTTLGLDWIEAIWKEIASRQYENLDPFESIPVIPLRCDINSHNEKHVKYLTLKGNYMVAKFDDNEPLPEALEKVLELMGIHILTPEQTIKFPHAKVIGTYIKLPISDNVLKCFKQMKSLGKPDEVAKNINEKCSDKERIQLSNYLMDHCSDIHKESQSFLRMLKMFKQHDNVTTPDMVSFTENETAITKFTYPKGLLYPRKLLLKEYAQLAKHFGGDEIEVKDCIDETLDLMLNNSPKYSSDDKVRLIVYLTHQSDDVLDYVQQRAEELVFMPSSDGKTYRVKDLFEATLVLQDLFLGEKGVFPDETFLQEKGFKSSFLSQLKIKTEENVSQEDLVRVARSIDNSLDDMKQDQLLLKAESLCKFLKRKPLISQDILDEMADLNWIPVNTVKPEGYPDGLLWYRDMDIVFPSKVKSSEFQNLVGSVIPLVSEDKVNKQVASHYRWNHLPDQNLVLDQLKNIIESYQLKQNSEYMHLTKAVFKYLDDLRLKNNLTSQSIENLCSWTSIPTKNGFRSADMVVIAINNSHIAFNLEPYIYELPSDMLDYSQTFMKIGVRNCVDFEVLKSLLSRLSQKYSTPNETAVSHEEVRKDRTLVVNILKAIIDMRIDKAMLTDLLVPITSPDDCLRFEIVENCTYTSGRSQLSANLCGSYDDDDDDNDGSAEEKVIYVHADISSLAPSLGVASITKRFIFNQKTEVLAWGQEEKLTTRISNLLDSYTDGFAVPKELVQNADDAGATKVCFLFDERENMDCRDGLFDPGLAECQGQTLWVYNDATFEEKDFDNIIKLGGKTKIMETDKIGKFGLGFCSIYNLTDVPSFVSKKTFVLLDPHLHHLGDAAIGTNPGLRVPLTKSYRKNFPNQFFPFNGIFGCNLTPSNKEEYKGTLFRLPLRTQKQALDNEIKKLPYTKREVAELLLKFVEAAGNLLLFTQNVTEISVYHLDSKSTQPEAEKQLLFKTWKKQADQKLDLELGHGFNVLKDITCAMKSNKEKWITLPVHVVDIGIEVYNAALTVSSEFEPLKQVLSWIISWGTGSDSFELAHKLEAQGAVPIGCVAVPVERNANELLFFRNMSKLGSGFYSKSRIFCFLPLPLETEIPLHINGCFMVEQDRKSLISFNKDNKVNDGATWNEAIMEDIIKSAYIHLLTFVASRSRDGIVETNYWTLWPQIHGTIQQDLITLLIHSFYRHILCNSACVFYRKRNEVGCSLNQSVFLDIDFRSSGESGQTAFECMLEFHQGESVVMDMPQEIFKNFEQAAQNDIGLLNSRFISKNHFFENYFFPHLKDAYWQIPEMIHKRNKLIVEALEDVDLHYIMKMIECIPVKNSNVLRCPSELVSETGLVSEMFDVRDERFPDSMFDEHKTTLLKMGMLDTSIPLELLTERAQTVQYLGKESGLIRSAAIVKYLNSSIAFHVNTSQNLKSIPFLPIMAKPSDWPLPWKADDLESSQYFMQPENLYSCTDKSAVGSVGYIMDCENDDVNEMVLKWIGIQEASIEKIVEQLNVLANENLLSSNGLESTCELLYEKLDYHLRMNSTNLIVVNSLKNLQTKRIIIIEDKMTEPVNVAILLPGGPCKPFLYELPKDLKDYKTLWQFIGIPNLFEETIFKKILQEEAEQKKCEPLEHENALSIVNIVKNLCYSLDFKRQEMRLEERKQELGIEERRDVFVPDEKNIMRCLLDVCYEDVDFEYEDDDVFVIHGEITQKMIKTLGIMSKRNLYLSRFSDSIPFGQKEKLVTRLKGIIDAYPKNHSVLNELLQNADDAKATEIHFVYDLRQHATEKIFDKKWERLQGPALCVFNNASFTEKDLAGIQNLGEGSKSDDPTKTGQFGIGFNAVYHLTDVPSFLTRGQSTPNGGAYCVFDPHCAYLPIARPDAPGMRLNIDRLESKYNDVYKSYLQDIIPAETGTWFRFPLRTHEMAIESRICIKSTREEDMNKLLKDMNKQMQKCLLFLSNIKKISISYIRKDMDKLSDTTSICLSIPELYLEQVEVFMLGVAEEAKKLKSRTKTLREVDFKEVRYTATLSDNKGSSDSWLIVQTFGFNNRNTIPDRVVDAFSNGEMGFLPRGGTAMHTLSHDPNHQNMEDGTIEFRREIGGQAFCFLPLPIPTGLPVHINGHFSVFANRNGLFTIADDIRTIWNKLLMEQNIAHSYASCIEYASNVLPTILENFDLIQCLYTFFNGFPNIDELTSDLWKELASAVFTSIHDRELNVFPICPEYSNYKQHLTTDHQRMKEPFVKDSMQWIPLQSKDHCFKACFDNLHSYFENEKQDTESRSDYDLSSDTNSIVKEELAVRQMLVDAGMKLICTPLWIYHSMCKVNIPENEVHENAVLNCMTADILSPQIVIRFFKSWETNARDKCCIEDVNVPISTTIFKTVDQLFVLLKYCLPVHVKKNDEIDGLPMLANNKEELVTFSLTRNFIRSEFCNLLPSSSNMFVHHRLVDLLYEFDSFFQNLNIDTFCSLLPQSVDQRCYKQRGPIVWDDSQQYLPDKEWIKKYWEYLESVEDLSKLKQWCLFPVLWCKRELCLVSFETAFRAVNYKSFEDDDLMNILKKLSLPTVSTLNESSKHLRCLMASEKDAERLARCLINHKDIVAKVQLTANDCDTILTYFAMRVDKIGDEFMENLKHLRLLSTISKRIVAVVEYERILVVETNNSSIVLQGLDELADRTNTVLIKHNSFHVELYKVLNFEICRKHSDRHELTELYLSFVLPHFDQLGRNAHLVHLEFIRDKLLIHAYDDLVQKLKMLAFVPSAAGNSDLRRACEFYSPHNTVFEKLCEPAEFPVYPFNQISWREFMEIAGIKQKVSKEQFINFARQIQDQRKSDVTLQQSKELVRHLFSQNDLEFDSQFLAQISEIQFIVPFEIPSTCSRIYPQILSDHLVAFKGSVPNKHFEVVWTMENILPKYAVPSKQSIFQRLQIKSKPSLQTVISHIHKICTAMQKSYTHDQCVYIRKLMNKIYSYLEDQTEDQEELRIRLAETPIIHIIKHRTFIKAKQAILKGGVEMPPYLLLGSEEHGHHFALFRRLGAKDEVDLNHYIRILASIKEYCKEGRLAPPELKLTEQSVRGMLRFLQLGHQDNLIVHEPTCYLLSESDVLEQSCDLVYEDRYWLKKRLKSQTKIHFLKSMQNFEELGCDVKSCLALLPDNIRPKVLSKIVQEVLLTTQNRIPWDVATKLESFLSSEICIHAMLRLALTKNRYDQLQNEVKQKISSNIKSIRIMALQNVQTILIHQNQQIESSIEDKKMFYDPNEQNICYISYCQLDLSEWVKKNCYPVASWIQKLCMFKVKTEHVQTVLTNYEAGTEEMSTLLDDLKAVPLDYKPEDASWIPPPGTPIPQELLRLLVQDLASFSPGDYAAYEVFDNLDDDDEKEKAEIYIYVKIVKQVTNNRFPEYEIDVGEGQIEKVLSFRLFKIKRPKEMFTDLELHTDGHKNYNEAKRDEIFQEIEETLVDAWRLDRSDFRRIFKRLLLHWHPDKNRDSKFCTEVTQFIIDFVNKLQSGEIDVSIIPEYRERHGNSSSSDRRAYRQQWNEDISRASSSPRNSCGQERYAFDADGYADRIGRRHRNAYRNGNAYWGHSQKYSPDPQPQMGKIWIKQAKNDITAARSLLSVATEKSYNWVCVTAHQAAEKALKSIQVSKDAKQVSNGHSLMTTVAITNPTLNDAAQKLERLVGDYTKMRYPRPVFYPRAPSDLYDKDSAEEAVKLAEIIVSTVDDML